MTASRRAEDHMVRVLADEGLLRRSRLPLVGRSVLTIAAGMLLFAGGWASANLRFVSTPAVQGDAYVMLLYPSKTFRSDPAHSAEYGAWAREAHSGGRVVDGHELGETIAVLGEPSGEPNGLFVIQAPSAAEAVRLARSTPHLHHGGSVILRAAP